MKNLTRKISSILTLLSLTSCSSIIYEAAWQTKPVVADGIPTEWSIPLRLSDPKSGLQYNITNDESNLYICIRATEQPAQIKILSSGMQIWLDPSGKNKQTVSIQFPLPGIHNRKSPAEDVQQDMTRGKLPGRMNLEKQFQLQKPEIKLTGFLPEYNGTFEASQAKGVKAALAWNEQGTMTYEVVIPLKSFYTKDITTPGGNTVIGIKINIAAMTIPQGSGSRGGGMQGGGQRHSGMGGGQQGLQGGGHSRGMGERPQSPDSHVSNSLSSLTSIKFKIKLNGLVKK